MTSLVIEQFAAPDTARKARALERAHRRAAEELAGRTVWCVAAARTGAAAAAALQTCLGAGRAEGVAARGAPLRVGEPLTRLIERLDAMLRGGRASPELGPESWEVYVRGMEDSEELIGHGLRAGDVVVLHDPIAGALAQAVRSGGAHAVWRLALEPRRNAAVEAWRFLRLGKPCLDAYVTGWRPAGLAAFISAPDVVCAKEVRPGAPGQTFDELGWTSLLADVVRGDRDETVGGTLHARPSVAAR